MISRNGATLQKIQVMLSRSVSHSVRLKEPVAEHFNKMLKYNIAPGVNASRKNCDPVLSDKTSVAS